MLSIDDPHGVTRARKALGIPDQPGATWVLGIVGNILWLILGGAIIAAAYFAGAVALCLTIFGIPFGTQLFKLGFLALWPVGTEVLNQGTAFGCLGVLGNVIWFLCDGALVSALHLILAGLFAITIVLLPFAVQHCKLATIALAPFSFQIAWPNPD
ncbi:MAG: hypothetical protein EXR99_11015 [Gemmataceae bacterium]|nr:hypothetical protein [Gemmataceae bacterium]